MGRNHSVHDHVPMLGIAIAVILTVLASSFPAQADIVYHSAKITIYDGIYNLDLNGDGATDFVITSSTSGACQQGAEQVEKLSVTASSGNGVLVGPLHPGSEIGPDQAFGGGGILSELVTSFVCGPSGCKCIPVHSGPWGSSTTGYLGLNFRLNGQTHYGWARLSLSGITAKLTGYAYETTPGMPTGAGQIRYAKFTPSTLNFGTVTLGDSASGSVTITNLGPTTLPINNATLTGVNLADFSSENSNPPCGGSVPAGGTCTLTFSFTPSFSGSEQAAYNVYYNDDASPQKLKLSGTGVGGQSCIPIGKACYGPGPKRCCPAPFPHHSVCSSKTGWGVCLML